MRKIKLLIACMCVCFVSCTHADNKNVNASDIIKMIQKGKPVQMANKVIFGDLNFADALKPELFSGTVLRTKIESTVFFSGCVFTGKVTATSNMSGAEVQTCFGRNLVFQECDFRDTVNFDNIEVSGVVNFQKSTFRKPVSFNGMTAWTSNGVFSYIKAEAAFEMQAAKVRGTLNMSNSEFAGFVRLQNLSVDDSFLFNSVRCNSSADLSLLRTGGRAMFNYTVFGGSCMMLMSRFGGDAEFVKTEFAKKPNFENVVFYGRAVQADSIDLSNSIQIIK